MYRFLFLEVYMLSLFPLLLLTMGAFSLVRYRKHLLVPKRLFSPLCKADKTEKRKTGKTLLLALSGTLGVGNITGVATALLLGGAGSVFWMVLSTIFSVALKYSEATLSTKCGEGGGMAGVLKNTYRGKIGEVLSVLYAIAFLALALILGGAVQGNAIVENATVNFPLKKGLLILVLVALLSIAFFGKTERILNILSFTLPIATVLYFAMCSYILFTHFTLLSGLLNKILKEAFQGVRPTLAGILGTFTKNAVREGFFAGLLSNEAGAGTSAMAHSKNGNVECSGAVGVLEVLFDTTFFCSISAITFLLTDGVNGAKNAGEVLYQTFFPSFGTYYIFPLFFSVFFLAISSVLCYFIYARRMLSFLRLEKFSALLPFFFLAFVALGGIVESTPLVVLSHGVLSVLSVLTSLATLGSFVDEKRKANGSLSKKGKRNNRLLFIKLFKNGKNC